jgi:replicative DNA helicase
MTQIESERTRQAPNGGSIPPSAIEAEESLIGAMLLSQEAVSIAYETVQAEDFYRPLHGQIFSSIIALANAGEPVDYVTVQAKLQERGAIAVELAVLSSLQMNTPSAANAQHYAEWFARRPSSGASSRSPARSSMTPTSRPRTSSGLIDEAERKINAIGDAGRTDTVSPLQRLLLSEADILEERGETRGRINGLETGYKSLDQILQGLQPSSMTIIGARPGTGKTAFALGILIHVGAVVKRPALFFSLEMSRQELAERILASTARIDSSKLRTGDLSDADWNRAHEAFGFLQSAKVFIDDNPA